MITQNLEKLLSYYSIQSMAKAKENGPIKLQSTSTPKKDWESKLQGKFNRR